MISINKKTYVIAEIGINHDGKVQNAKHLIDEAKKSGADAVKIQIRKLSETYTQSSLKNTKNEQGVSYLVNALKKTQLSKNDYIDLRNYANENEIDFIATPFDISSVQFLAEKLIPTAIKVGSPDLTNSLLLNKVKEYSFPVILSTGMSTQSQIEIAVSILKHCDLYLLHCTSTYPAFPQDLHINCIQGLTKKFNIPVGYSSHEKGYIPTLAAVACGARIIERHITDDPNKKGPDHIASLTPNEFKEMILAIRMIETSMGDSIKPLIQGEKNNALALRKSLVYKTKLKSGTIIRYDHLAAKSPAKGIQPQNYKKFIGKKLIINVNKDELLEYSHTENVLTKRIKQRYNLDDLSVWGIVVRLHDINSLIYLKPSFVEVHLTWRDIKQKNLEIYNQFYNFGLTVHAPEYIENDILLDLTTDDDYVYNASIKHLSSVVQLTNKLSKQFTLLPNFDKKTPLVIHPGGHFRVSSRETREYRYARLKQALNNIEWGETFPLVENLPPFPWYYGGQYHNMIFMDPHEINEFCESTGYSICLDISHAALYCNDNGINLSSFVSKVIKYSKYLHISDAEGTSNEGLQIGKGTIDFSLLRYLFKTKGGENTPMPFIPEIWQGHVNKGAGFKIALENLSKI
jgi:sialic acid synthase SpsE/endonuclease IV